MELPTLEESWKPFPFEEKDNKTVIFGTDPQKGGKKFGETCWINKSVEQLKQLKSSQIPVSFLY